MPFQLLKMLSTATMPVQIDGEEDIDKLLILHAAGYAEAELPPTVMAHGRPTYSGAAKVLSVTEAGREALKNRGM